MLDFGIFDPFEILSVRLEYCIKSLWGEVNAIKIGKFLVFPNRFVFRIEKNLGWKAY